MGRRSTHTPQQLRELILDAAQDIIQAQGLAGLSAREVARRIEYSPGTIYNMFENLDDVVLHVEARVLDALDKRLSTVLADGIPTDRVGRLAQTYLAFTHENFARIQADPLELRFKTRERSFIKVTQQIRGGEIPANFR